MPVEQLYYTDRERGKGTDPTRSSGYQVAAVSPGLDAETTRLLGAICTNYGQTVYTRAPRAAKDKEAAWLPTGGRNRALPTEVLNEFPVVWSYDRLDEERYALTRVGYLGWTYDGRLGNFFAHSLVFPPGALAALDHCPLAVARAGAFTTTDPGDVTALQPLQDPAAPSGPPSLAILRAEPYRNHLAAMVAALGAAVTGESARPVVICLPDWRPAMELVEALLHQLPPSCRSHATFCTYEGDRNWLPSTPTGRPAGRVAAHDLLVIYADDERALGLRPDEYTTRFAVFNFAGNQFSPTGEPSPFATMTALCSLEGCSERLVRWHNLVEALGAGRNWAAWDQLTPAAALVDSPTTPEKLAAAVQALAAVARDPSGAAYALEHLMPHIRRAVAAGETDNLVAIAGGIARLVDLLSAPSPEPSATVAELRQHAGQALQRGQARLAAALLQATGAARTTSLLALCTDLTADTSRQALRSKGDREQLVALLAEGARIADADVATVRLVPGLIHAAFRAADDVGLAEAAWRDLGESVIRRRLDGRWGAEHVALARELLEALPDGACVEGRIWLSFRLLEETHPVGERLEETLAGLVEAGTRSKNSMEMTEKLLAIAQEQLPEGEPRAVGLGRMAEAGLESPMGERLYRAYREVISKQPKPARIHQRLAQAGVTRILCWELADEVLPWNGAQSATALEGWGKRLFAEHPLLFNAACEDAAVRLRQSQSKEVLPFAMALITLQYPHMRDAQLPGRTALYAVITRALPLVPGAGNPGLMLGPPPVGLAPELVRRLEVLSFLQRIEGNTGKVGWSPAAFPHSDPAWRQMVATLSDQDKEEVVAWCVRTFTATGVGSQEDAEGLVTMLAAVGRSQPAQVAETVLQLLKGRDAVTQVLAATAFACCVLDRGGRRTAGEQYFREITIRLERDVRQLLDQHLERRFAPADPAYRQRLQELRSAVGFAPASAPPGDVSADEPSEASMEHQATRFVQQGVEQGRRFFRSLLGRDKPDALPHDPHSKKDP